MKRTFILVAIALFAAGLAVAEEKTLIDFTKLKADIVPSQDNVPTENRATMMDYSRAAGASFTADQKAIMRTSLALSNWDIVLASSSKSVINQSKSYTLPAPSKQYGTVFGARVHFPVENFNSWALIQPPFEIPGFEPANSNISDDGTIGEPSDEDKASGKTRFEEGYGVVKNVGVIKSISVDVYGLNFPNGLSVVLKDANNEEHTYFMGYLNFDGWGRLVWNNPNYVSEVRNRELRIVPLYPNSTPFVKFAGFLVHRDAAQTGGDFIAYFKNVDIIYDKAVIETDRDIADEDLWNIIKDREDSRTKSELQKFGNVQVMRYLDKQKQATETVQPLGTAE